MSPSETGPGLPLHRLPEVLEHGLGITPPANISLPSYLPPWERGSPVLLDHYWKATVHLGDQVGSNILVPSDAESRERYPSEKGFM